MTDGSAIRSGARTEARRARRPAETQGRTVLFPNDVLDGLTPHADLRRITVNELVRRIVETALDDGMIDAILDDLAEEAA